MGGILCYNSVGIKAATTNTVSLENNNYPVNIKRQHQTSARHGRTAKNNVSFRLLTAGKQASISNSTEAATAL